ncbi:hypothetical protein A4D02_35275 [Niastella koreensis]|uniref:Secretion system C-terminal sorting domain-containing protein n=2 Tax=Niastella koreensis TaxID=354356 RepID=G8TBS7_NIAKG|nr:T9SS type A sorting domain-containing protein [Niastella koreensis]AEV98209.1 hypothetical protein Niako_1851 [Niastella koreensis GR20-10]OQP44319.1 hypothetical protein A4D02_35275 [Niastella koreensis]
MSHPFTQTKQLVFFLLACIFSSQAFAQTTTTFPPATSCTSKDLTLVGATLPGSDLCNTCTAGDSVYRNLNLRIYNKTGSTRTAFAFWGTLVIRNSNGTISSTRSINGCGGPVVQNDTTTLVFNKIGYVCGQSLTIKDLFLAWTDASPKSTCATLNSATINPKCGTLDSIQINTGLNASFSVTNATCSTPGAIDMTPMGGKAPYTYSWVASNGGVIPTGQATQQDLTGLVAGTYTVTITDALNCRSTRFTTVTASAPVTANAGDDFTKTCSQNANGKQIGETAVSGFTYSWSPATGLSDATASNPTANPSSTTTYTVTKTNTTTGCSNTDQVVVTVNNTAVVVNAGDDFTKNCISNTSGKQIGETAVSGFTYSWSPATGLSDATASNPTANPSTTTTYTVTKTNTTTGCSNTDQVMVTVDNAVVTANAGDDFTKTCTSNASGKQIGETAVSGFTYSWSPATGLSNATASNPTANPSATTTYTVTKTNTTSGCSNTDQVMVTVTTNAPATPTICVVQPSLCGPTTGSVTIKTPLGADYQYSIDNGGTWQTSPVFSNLPAGSVTGIKVSSISSGCISNGVSCDASDCSQPAARLVTDATAPVVPTEGQTTVKAFPNPFSTIVKFVVTIPEAGKGSLEVYNLLGQKVKTVFQGSMLRGINTFDVNMPLTKSAQLMYVLRIGNKTITGKLLQLNQ